MLFGASPKSLMFLVVSGKSVAEARDAHYHRPPDYLVLNPKIHPIVLLIYNKPIPMVISYKPINVMLNQPRICRKWGENALEYSPTPEYQQRLRSLYGQFVYRLDTNYAKIDRIEHKEIEQFKTHVLNTEFHGMTIKQWSNIIIIKR